MYMYSVHVDAYKIFAKLHKDHVTERNVCQFFYNFL